MIKLSKYMIILAFTGISACASFQKQPDTVWDMYDVRRFNQTGPIMPNNPAYYRDNDAAYTSPQTSFGLCSDSDLAGFSCE